MATVKDNTTTAVKKVCHSISRRALLKVAPATAFVGCAPVLSQASEVGKVRQIVDEWKMCWDNEGLASEKPGGGNFDSPEGIYWRDRHMALREELKQAALETKDDAAALVEYITISHGMEAEREMMIEAETWALEKFAVWAA